MSNEEAFVITTYGSDRFLCIDGSWNEAAEECLQFGTWDAAAAYAYRVGVADPIVVPIADLGL